MARALIQQLDRMLGPHGSDEEEYREEMTRPREGEDLLEFRIKGIKKAKALNDIYLKDAENQGSTLYANECKRHELDYERKLKRAQEELRAFRANNANSPGRPRAHAELSRSRSPHGRRAGSR